VSTPATAGSCGDRFGGGVWRDEVFPTHVRTCFAIAPITEDCDGRGALACETTRSSSPETGVATESVASDVVVVLKSPADWR